VFYAQVTCEIFPRIYTRALYFAHLRSRVVTFSTYNRDDTPAPHVCEAFFQKLPEQDVQNTFMLLVPGRPLVAQGKTWVRCDAEGLGRLRNLATATLLASFKPLTDEDREKFRIADKESTSLFFLNGSIFLVATSRDQIKVSADLKNLPWEKSSYKIVAANFYQVEEDTNECPIQDCTNHHACCGSSVLCIQVAPVDSLAAKIGDATNFQKALEDDVAKRVLHEIFDDNSFVMNTSIRCVRPKLT
jgi:hypothetical protein